MTRTAVLDLPSRVAQSGGSSWPLTPRTACTLLAVDLMRLAIVPRAAAYKGKK